MKIREYNPETDYLGVLSLYKEGKTFGGQYDNARDTEERLSKLIKSKPESILVAEDNERICGTVTLFEDGRSAWLYRFAVASHSSEEVSQQLYVAAKEILEKWGHEQVLVYAPAQDAFFEERYTFMGLKKGRDYTCYWQDIS